MVGGVLARAVQQSAGHVRLHAFTFASNHFHHVLVHGVKEGLVERSAEWPGLTCLPQLVVGKQGAARE